MLTPTLFGIFFMNMPRYAFGALIETYGIYLHTKLTESKVCGVLIRDMHITADAAPSEDQLQQLMDKFPKAC